jgi:hypothetical protein
MIRHIFTFLCILLFSHGCMNINSNLWKVREDHIICIKSSEQMKIFKDYAISIANQYDMAIYDRSKEAEQELIDLNSTDILNNTRLPLIMVSFQKNRNYRFVLENGGTMDGMGLTFSYNSTKRPEIMTKIISHARERYNIITRDEYTADGYPKVGASPLDCI